MRPKNGKEILEENFRNYSKSVKSEVSTKSSNFKEFILPHEGFPNNTKETLLFSFTRTFEC